MKKLALIVAIGITTAISIAVVTAGPLDWWNANDGVAIDGATAYPGCAPAASASDQKARKTAILKAQARIARTRNIAVSGEEHGKTQQGEDSYSVKIEETANAYLRPVAVIKELMTNIDGTPQLCVLVVEKRNEE